MKGVEALAHAILDATDRRYTVPGYPVTELGPMTGAEMVINEKTGLEYALGDSLLGRRAAVIVKNVGVNACVDPLLQATAQGLVGGVLLVAGDDPDAVGSQTSQDTRIIGELAEIPVIEPGSGSAFRAVEAALQASEEFSRVAMIRVTPGFLEGEATDSPVPRKDSTGRLSDRSYTMHGRVMASRTLFRKMQEWADASPLNAWCGEPAGVGPEPGRSRVVTVFPPPARLAEFRQVRRPASPSRRTTAATRSSLRRKAGPRRRRSRNAGITGRSAATARSNRLSPSCRISGCGRSAMPGAWCWQ